MAANMEMQSATIVRAYSFEVEQRIPPGNSAHVLGHVLAERERGEPDLTAPWRVFFETPEAKDSDSSKYLPEIQYPLRICSR